MRIRYGSIVGTTLLFAAAACGGDDDHHHNGEFRDFDRAVILDRGQTSPTEVAEWNHGEGWSDESALPEVGVGEDGRISLGMEVYDESGTELIEDGEGEFTARYALADDADDTVLDLDREFDDIFHGDHVHIYGEEPGDTEITFVMWHGDHVHGETSAIEITVADGDGGENDEDDEDDEDDDSGENGGGGY